MFVSATSPVVLCTYNFVYIMILYLSLSFLLARLAANSYSIFMLPVGLCQIANVSPMLTIMFKDVLRTFEAEILKRFIFSPKLRRSYYKNKSVQLRFFKIIR